MSRIWADTFLLSIVAVLGINVLLGGYLFLEFVSALAQTKRATLWMVGYALGCFLFVGGLGMIFDGGIWLLCANLLVLGCTVVAVSRHRAATQRTPPCQIQNE